MLTIQTLIEKLKTTPEQVQFNEVISIIDQEFDFTPTAFTNGDQNNAENENNGSCKILSFAQLNQLNESETLHLFGDFYRVDVLANPNGEDHQNIRQFIKHGWSGVSFSVIPLTSK